MAVISREHGERTGFLDYLDWDIAAWKVIGATYNEEKNELAMPLGFFVEKVNPDPDRNDLVEVDFARVLFKKPEPTHFEFDLPLVVINMDDASPATNRLYPLTEQYRVPAEGAQRVSANGVLGWSHYETRDQDEPFDFTYSYEVWARDRIVARQMLQILQAAMPPLRGKITVMDSLDCPRVYFLTQESTSDLTEVSSLVDRIAGYSLTVRIQGELTLDRLPITTRAVTGETQDTPARPGDPDPGAGGVYATGSANVTLTPNQQSPILVGSSPGVFGFEKPGTASHLELMAKRLESRAWF